MIFFDLITCENQRRGMGIPAKVETAVAPIPTAVEKEEENATFTGRTAKNGTVKTEMGYAIVRFLLEAFGNMELIPPKSLKDPGIEANMTRRYQAFYLFFASDGVLSPLKHGLEADFAKINLGKRE